MARYFIRIAYNGTNYSGWQVQQNAPTVQAELDKAMSLLMQTTIETLGCGRTDTGVHAADFFAHFDVEEAIPDVPLLVYKLNKFLSPDIYVKEILRVTDDAHARFAATEREYEYHIVRYKSPFAQKLAHYYFGDLDLGAMNTAAAYLLTISDFKAFSKEHTDVKTTLCTVTKAVWNGNDEKLVFTIAANRFLRNMVRALVGTLLDVGRGKITLDDFKAIAASLDRGKAGDSAPAEGLYLTKITYPPNLFINKQQD